VIFTNKISLGGEPSLAVSAGVGLGMCPGVSCSHICITLKAKLTATDSNMTKHIIGALGEFFFKYICNYTKHCHKSIIKPTHMCKINN
jgi:hypothetical protein